MDSLRITGNNYQRANEWLVENYHNPNHLDGVQQSSPVGIDDDIQIYFDTAMEIQDELERIESDDEQSEDGFPTKSFKKVKRILDERKFVFYRAGKSLDICIMVALKLINNNESESVCEEFIEEVLPDCITAHVNPNESFKYTADHIERSYQFCCVVIPLLAARLRKLPVNRVVSLSICQLLNIRNRLLQIVRRTEVSQSHMARLQSKEWVAFCDPNRLIAENSHPNGILQDVLNLLTIPETIARFVDPSTVRKLSYDWISSIAKMLEAMEEKQIRDGLDFHFYSNVSINIFLKIVT
uniref:Zinc finger protein n=1 Tax=Heterorhabditis bacteriophora TaxID=37862 RepID=A0A1I7WJS4_HETBA